VTGRDSLMAPDDNRRMFDRIARRYDLMNTVLSLGLARVWRRRAVGELLEEKGVRNLFSQPCSSKNTGPGREKVPDPFFFQRYLDLGCGTGKMGIEIVRRCRTARVVGLYPAERMLEIARAKAAAAGLAGSVTFLTGDAADLPFGDGEFAGIVTAFCIRNVADRLGAMREMRRVLAPGGRAVILELTVPSNPLLAAGHRLYSRYLVPLAGGLIARSREAYQYLVDSVAEFPPATDILTMLTRAGLANPRALPLHGGIVTLFTAGRT
jgi:demethylmenaquinone methyltransferase/2-methoxy-6-polyprenyl-1,4-benzoquinol methylase